MKPLCEITAGQVLPFIRALVAKSLVENGLSQSDAARKLGMSQPAISQYKRELRGSSRAGLEGYPKLLEMVNSIARGIAEGSLSPEQTTLEFCRVCKYLKVEGIICKLHRELYQNLESCNICLE